MKIASFALGMLAVSTQALDTLDFTTNESQNIMAGFSMWNCSTCTLAFAGLDRILRNEKVEGAIEAVATKVCEIGDIVAGGDTVCPDAVRQYAPDLFDAAVRNLLSKDRMCNQVLGLCKNPVIEEIFLKNVVDDILSTKPTSLANDDFITKLYAEITADKNEREIIRAVHISDVHIDKEYLSGSKAKCDSFLCCRAESGTPAPGDILAGDWGSNAGLCDLPVKTFESLMENVVNVQKPDILFWTGDNSPHNIWDNTMEEVTDYTKSVTDIIKNAIKDSDITVIPIHGNHDTWPVDEQDFSTPNSNYPINHIKEYWSDWLGDAKDKYGEYGYYSKDLTLKNGKALPAGSKVIAINTNSCDAINFYMWGERSDPGNQFEWLELQLAQIEANNGIALMLGHYTPSSCQH